MKLKNYRNENKKLKKNIYILELKTWDEYICFINRNKKTLDGCIYRGQSDSSWKLKPSFFRLIENMDHGVDLEKFQALAVRHTENFKKQVRGRCNISYSSPEEYLGEWLSLGQHYGLATPLLDWVYSPYVAAFFSFSEQIKNKGSVSIFIFDIKGIEAKLFNFQGNQGKSKCVQPICDIEIFDPLTHENKRMVSQQGIFTYIQDFNFRSIEEYLYAFHEKCEISNEEFFLIKITIPNMERTKALVELNLMNINKLTLFPDISGSAEHCNYLLENEVMRLKLLGI